MLIEQFIVDACNNVIRERERFNEPRPGPSRVNTQHKHDRDIREASQLEDKHPSMHQRQHHHEEEQGRAR